MISLSESNLWREIHEQPDCIHRCLAQNTELCKEIANEVKKRDVHQVVFVARGSSEHAAQAARYVFEVHCGMLVSIAAPSVITCYHSKINYAHTLMIGISQSGGAKDVGMVMEQCVEQGGLCVSITNEPDSLMSSIGAYRLNNGCGAETSITAAKSYITQLTLLCLIAAYISEDQALLSCIQNLEKTISYALTLEHEVRKLIPLHRNSEQLLLFGRGLLYGLAQEAELKIQETCYLDARSYAASDYQHGPIASTRPFVPTIFFIADEQTNDSILSLVHRMKTEYNISTTIITNKNTIAECADQAIVFDARYDGVSAVFVCAVIAQMFACLLSIARGYQPDNPIGVSKHTVTI